jgi:hypothetical protein
VTRSGPSRRSAARSRQRSRLGRRVVEERNARPKPYFLRCRSWMAAEGRQEGGWRADGGRQEGGRRAAGGRMEGGWMAAGGRMEGGRRADLGLRPHSSRPAPAPHPPLVRPSSAPRPPLVRHSPAAQLLPGEKAAALVLVGGNDAHHPVPPPAEHSRPGCEPMVCPVPSRLRSLCEARPTSCAGGAAGRKRRRWWSGSAETMPIMTCHLAPRILVRVASRWFAPFPRGSALCVRLDRPHVLEEPDRAEGDGASVQGGQSCRGQTIRL